MDFLITQLFFDNALYFDFLARARAAGIEVPIIPGIMPITHVGQVERMATMCGSAIPEGLRRELHARGDDPEAVLDFGVAYATLQCAELLAAGAPGIHFYTLNRSPATRAILSALKLTRPWEKAVYAGLDLEPLGHPRRAVGRLVAHVDRVVLAVGAHAPGAQQPSPAADLVLAQVPLEHERAFADREVDAEPLGHAVQVDLVGLAHIARQLHLGPGRSCQGRRPVGILAGLCTRRPPYPEWDGKHRRPATSHTRCAAQRARGGCV